MPRPKQLVKRAIVEVAKRRRTCRFSGAAISKGLPCLVVREGPRERSCYSREVGLEMIVLARERLVELEEQLAPGDAC